MLNLVFDHFIDGEAYPNLCAVIDLSKGTEYLELTWPRIIPVRLIEFCRQHNFAFECFHIDATIPSNSFYPVGLGWFDFSIDYISLIDRKVLDLCAQGRLKILFYYHEGDNPYKIKQRLDDLCEGHGLNTNIYMFVSANTEADQIPSFAYFPDHELFYWACSRLQPVLAIHDRPRNHRFTALSRRHHTWRATVMAWLHQQGYLEQSLWSYNLVDLDEDKTSIDPLKNNPIRLMPYHPGLDTYIRDFLSRAPYSCDDLTDQQHNTHDILVEYHYTDSYCNLVLETMFDADQSGGVFLSEKTFKPIRHAQPFVIFGCANSLQTLKDLGYRTFDHALVNHYDKFVSNTERFNYLMYTMRCLAKQNLHDWYQSCQADIEHNQRLFLSSKKSRLSNLHDKLLHQLATT